MTNRFKINNHRIDALKPDRFKINFEGSKGILNPKESTKPTYSSSDIVLLIIMIAASSISAFTISTLGNRFNENLWQKKLFQQRENIKSSEWNSRYQTTSAFHSKLFQADDLYFQNHDYINAAVIYLEILEQYPYNVRANKGLAKCLYWYCNLSDRQCLKTYKYLEFSSSLQQYKDPVICQMLEDVKVKLN